MGENIKESFEIKIYGQKALFTDPSTKVNEERLSYPVPTYAACIGMLESIYWKPTIKWYVDDVRVMKPFRMQSVTKSYTMPKKQSERQLISTTYLWDVEYRIRCHYEWDLSRENFKEDRDRRKHTGIFLYTLEHNPRRQLSLGSKDCFAYCEKYPFDKDVGAYDDVPYLSFGLMEHGITYDNVENTKCTRFWFPEMRNGVIHFIRPEECTILGEKCGILSHEFKNKKEKEEPML